MELANSHTADITIRAAQKKDLHTLERLLQEQFYTHTHADWHTLNDWLDYPGFLVWETELIHAFLTVTAAPPPAAWVRATSLRYGHNAKEQLISLMEVALEKLTVQKVTTVGWMSNKRWPDRWLPELDFEIRHHIDAYWKDDLELPPNRPIDGLTIRSVLPEEIKRLAQLEELVFDPLWRHDFRGMQLAWRQALSLDVALFDGRIVGFQHSVHGEKDSAHLARMTIHPEMQGQGVGSALLAHAIKGYAQRGRKSASLNTVDGNIAARSLYTKFGFTPIEYRLPVWVREL